jgi:hypothetical protein
MTVMTTAAMAAVVGCRRTRERMSWFDEECIQTRGSRVAWIAIPDSAPPERARQSAQGAGISADRPTIA